MKLLTFTILTHEDFHTILDAVDTAHIMFESINGLPIQYPEGTEPELAVRPGHFVREINLLKAAKRAMGVGDWPV